MTTSPIIRLVRGTAETRRWLLQDRRRRSLSPNLPDELLAELRDRFGPGATPESAVRQILQEVEQDGEAALRRWSRELDDADPDPLVLTRPDLKRAWQELPAAQQQALQAAYKRVAAFHQAEPRSDWTTEALGGRLGQRLTPIERVGVYTPGGTAPLPSSLLMCAVPARVAGVSDLIVATPPPAAPIIQAAAHLCGAQAVLQAGGAQAIAALAFGTETLNPVDKITGPGGLFVTLAKRAVYGLVGIDGLFGPTETMLITDDSARPAWLAADLLAQAEHDVLASAVLLTDSEALAQAVQVEVTGQVDSLSRRAVIQESLQNRGGIGVVEDIRAAVDIANQYAPEHLCLCVRDVERWQGTVVNAGGIFLGEASAEVLGDYLAGPSHVMPTGGSARFAGPLTTRDFLKVSSVIALDASTAAELAGPAAALARLEGLTGHAAAADLRREDYDA